MLFFLRSLVCLLLLTSACQAQTRKPDIIVKRDNTKIEALVKKIDETTIEYQKFSNLAGPVYTIRKEDVVTILYANGEVENVALPSPVARESLSSAKPIVAPQKAVKAKLPKSDSDAPVSVKIGSKQEIFLSGYGNSTNEQLLKDIEKYRRKSSKGKVWGTIVGTGGVAIMVVGLINTAGAESEAKFYLSRQDYGNVVNPDDRRFSSDIISAVRQATAGISDQLNRAGTASLNNEISREDYLAFRLEALTKARDIAAPIIAKEYRQQGLTTTLIGVGVAGLATAIYLRGATAGWKHKLLKQEAGSKGLSMQIFPDWHPMQGTAGIRLVGRF